MTKAQWFVYLLKCQDGTLYCGATTDPVRRTRQHNGELEGGAKYTSARRPVKLLAFIKCGSRSEAQRLEAEIKKLPASQKTARFCLAT